MLNYPFRVSADFGQDFFHSAHSQILSRRSSDVLISNFVIENLGSFRFQYVPCVVADEASSLICDFHFTKLQRLSSVLAEASSSVSEEFRCLASLSLRRFDISSFFTLASFQFTLSVTAPIKATVISPTMAA